MIFIQTGNFYRSMSKKEQEHLEANLTESLMFVSEEDQKKIIRYLKKVDPALGERVEKGL